MKIVIYDDETLEPITFVNLRGLSRRDIEDLGMIWRVPVPQPIDWQSMRPDVEPSLVAVEMEVIDLCFERFRRNTRKHGEQETIMCFTSAVDLAVRLKPDWMLGQRSAVDYLQTQNDRLTDMLMGAISR